jgi:thiamine-monophosphate kinase
VPRGRTRSEEDWIRRIQQIFPTRNRHVLVSIGDDAAILKLSLSSRVVITTDQMVEGVHFQRETHPPVLLGEKALAVNLSDLAAMGASPSWALLSLFLPPDLSHEYLEAVLRGMARLARREGVVLIGGNLTTAKVLALDVTLLGTMTPGLRPLSRHGARPGDTLYVSGTLGGAALGLSLLRAGWRWSDSAARRRQASSPAMRGASAALKRHLAPDPELKLGRLLARHALATSAMDLSDGLSKDLHRLCRASRVGARILAAALPLDSGAVHWLGEEQALRFALHGGEDYRLLFSVPPRRVRRLCRLVPLDRLHPIGQVVSRRDGVKLQDEAGRVVSLPPLGYDHFVSREAMRGPKRR